MWFIFMNNNNNNNVYFLFFKKIIPWYSTYIKGISIDGVNQHVYAWVLDFYYLI